MELKAGLKRPPLPNKKPRSDVIDLFEPSSARRENYLLPKVSRILELHAISIEKSHWTPSSENLIKRTSYRKPRTASRESLRSGKQSDKRSVQSDYSEDETDVDSQITPEVSAKSWIIYEAKRGKYIHGKRIFKKR